MSLPSEARIADLLQPYVAEPKLTPQLISSIQVYLELLLKWNARTNLTAIRDPEELVQRQIGESLFAAQLLPQTGTLLDFGSGAGFPGIPIQMICLGLRITLAESQGKKAGFLREAVRTLALPCEIWPKRVEDLPVERDFDVVTMRAVDATALALPVAASRVAPGGSLLRYIAADVLEEPAGWRAVAELQLPRSAGRVQRLERST